MKVPLFPDLRPVEIGDRDIFKDHFVSGPPEISDLAFANIFGWRRTLDTKVTSLNGFLILSIICDASTAYLDPVGGGDKHAVMSEIMERTGNSFVNVPEKTARMFEGEKGVVIEPDRDASDYLYRAEDLIKLEGKKYDGKRNQIKKFRSNYRYSYVKLNKENMGECLDFEDLWCGVKSCDMDKGLEGERAAVTEMIKNCEDLALTGGAVMVDGRMSALCVASELSSETLDIHILKAVDIPGLYQVMNNEFMANEAAGYKYVNMEDDMGIEGLRKAKMSYHPVRMVDKFTIIKEQGPNSR